jgi:3-phosphoshikimate 1-carboxyvinyltransferase
MTHYVSAPCEHLAGSIVAPGDKSISHRALIMGALAVGETRVSGLLEAEDVLATMNAVRALGTEVNREDDTWLLRGRGIGGLVEPSRVLDLGNSGTGVRLLIGVAAGCPFTTFFTGDPSLCRRPMHRVIEPLRSMGASFWARSGDRLPVAVRGAADLVPIEYRLPVASAQVKSAVLLAGLHAPGGTTVLEREPTRDHTERMLQHFGARVEIELDRRQGQRITVTGQPELAGCPVTVPGDFSSAAFPLVAALVVPGSRVTIDNVGLNPLRTGLLDTLTEMGARLRVEPRRSAGSEPVGAITAEAGRLDAVDVPPLRVPSMIDEFPILAVAAACAHGTTRIRGIGELRVKESDRLTAIAGGLSACGVEVEAGDDWMSIGGCGGPPAGGVDLGTTSDHRIAMAFLVLGAAARSAVSIDDGEMIATSFPGFATVLVSLGAKMGRLDST